MIIVQQGGAGVKTPSSFPHTPYYHPQAEDRVQLKTTVAKDKSKLKTDRRFRFYIMKGREALSSWEIPDEKRKAIAGMLALHLKGKDHEQSCTILRRLIYLRDAVEQISGTMSKKQLCGWIAARIF